MGRALPGCALRITDDGEALINRRRVLHTGELEALDGWLVSSSAWGDHTVGAHRRRTWLPRDDPCDNIGMLVCMRTTINLPDALADAAKHRAAEEGRTFTSVVEEGLRTVLEARPERQPTPELPAYGDPSGRFLVDPSDRAALWEALDADEAR